jgi:hypothetical protein
MKIVLYIIIFVPFAFLFYLKKFLFLLKKFLCELCPFASLRETSLLCPKINSFAI